MNVKNICEGDKASAHKGRQLHAASSFPAIADTPESASLPSVQPPAAAEPVPPPPATEKKYRLPSGQQSPTAHLYKRTEERVAERRGAEPAGTVPPPAQAVVPPAPKLLHHLYLYLEMVMKKCFQIASLEWYLQHW